MAQQAPERPALYLGRDLVADYGLFHERAARVAGWLIKRGVEPGDRVAIYLSNSPTYLIVLYGIWYAGAVAVPVNAKLHAKEVAYILDHSGTRLCFATPKRVQDLTDAEVGAEIVDITGPDFDEAFATRPVEGPIERAPADLCWLFYTSGTTGRPKGVMITHRMLMAMSLSYQTDVDQVRPEDTALYAAPMSHGAGIYNMIHVRFGARHVCPVSGGFDPVEIFELARGFGNVHMFAAPTMVKRLTEAAKDGAGTGAGLRTIVYAGGPMYQADIIDAVRQFGPIFVQIYGQGECPMGITALSRHDVSDRMHPRWHTRLASVGRAQSAVEVRIAGEGSAEAPPGVQGEIMVRGDVVMPGYWKNEPATAQALRGGWLMTGDVGAMDADGYVTLKDRSKDVIITGGSNVYPREVEEVLQTHPDVREVAVVGRPHADWGEEVVAFVVGEAKEAELDQLCQQNIARFKRPKAYLRLETLPKNNYGKVLKTRLRELLEEQA